jgi:uncharacterized protein YdaU (DUF1376 family)
MSKEKDPAFLFYPKDWLQGTSEMMPEEKGVYIDLLAHQHQNGAIPNNTKRLARMVGLSEEEFLRIWEVVRTKFRSTDLNLLVNQKLINVVNKRSANSQVKKITGTFASVLRLSKEPQEIKEKIKERFNINQFLDITDEFLNQSITTWFGCAVKSIATATENGTGIEKGGTGDLVSNAEDAILKNEIEFEKICMLTVNTKEDAKKSLRKYHLYLEEKAQYPKTKKAIFAGFEKWLLNEINFKNGSATHQHPAKDSPKQGISDKRTNAARNW